MAPLRQNNLGLVQELTEAGLAMVFKSGLHLPEWALLRLVSTRWKALVNSCADCVNVGLMAAEWPELAEEAEEWAADQPCAKAAFSRLCYAL